MKQAYVTPEFGFKQWLAWFCLLAAFTVSGRAETVDWYDFTNADHNWSAAGSWINGIGPGAGSAQLVINIDTFNPAASTGGGGSFPNTGKNLVQDLGEVTLNQLNFSGSRSGNSSMTVKGGTLRFAGDNAAISDNSWGALLRFQLDSAVLLDTNLTVNVNNIDTSYGSLTFGATAGSVSTDTVGLKTVTVTGDGKVLFGKGLLSDGIGKIGVVMNGSGLLDLSSGAHSYSGGLVVNSGTVSIASSGAAGAAGTEGIVLGKAGSNSAAMLNYAGSVTMTNAITVNAGGERVIKSTGGSTQAKLNSLTLYGDLTLINATLGVGTRIELSGDITGTGNITFDSLNTVNTAETFRLGGNNSGFTGGVTVLNGRTNIVTDTALNAANTVAVASTGTLDINARTLSIAGLNDVAGGGKITNSGAAKTLTLAGSGTYRFGGTLEAATAANLAVTKSGSGVQILDGDSTYTGATNVTGGTLLVNGGLASAVTVSAGIGGDGSVASLSLSAGSFLSFDLNASFDGFDVVGALSGAGLAALDINLNKAGNLGEDPITLLTWGSGGAIDLAAINASLSGGLVLDTTYGTGGFDIVGNSLVVKFNAIPEPSTWLLLGIGVAVLGACQYRKRKA